MPFAVGARSTRISYSITGDQGPWVLLIHGLALSSRFWFDLPARLAHDPTHPCRVVTFDNRGTGQSDRPAPPYRMADMADDAAAVLDAAGIEHAEVVGISLGGMVAQHLALRHQPRVRGLVLLATTPGLPQGHLPHPRDFKNLMIAGFARGEGSAEALGKVLLSKRDRPRAQALFADWAVASATDPPTVGGLLGQLAAAALHSTASRLGAITCPAVIVAGEEDLVQPPDNSRLLAQGLPHAELEVLANVGHAIPLVDPEVISRSLAKLRSARPA